MSKGEWLCWFDWQMEVACKPVRAFCAEEAAEKFAKEFDDRTGASNGAMVVVQDGHRKRKFKISTERVLSYHAEEINGD